MNLKDKFLLHIGQTSPSPMLIEVKRAEGIFLYDDNDKPFYDLVSGVSVSNIGHNNKSVASAIKNQVDSFLHTMVYGELVLSPQVEYAEKITAAMGEGFEAVYFLNSGAEAIEVAMKLAKRYSGRRKIISAKNAYHGSTQGALSLCSDTNLKSGSLPLLPEVYHIEYNNAQDLKLIDTDTACVIIEVVQGEAGVRLPAKGYLESLRKRCNETGTLLIFDEIQTGMGRTGELFAFQKAGVTPDVVVAGKAFGGGLPLSGVITSKAILDSFKENPVLGHITTFGGNPLCCTAGLAAYLYIYRENLLDQVEEKGRLFESMLIDCDPVVEIRRCGLIMAVELGSSEKLFKIMEMFKEDGILSDWFLFCDTAFRISPPLTITNDEIAQCVDVIKRCFERLG